jgi:hypothetical protein
MTRTFLDGEDLTPLEHLQQEETAAAWALQFERAAALRDRWKILSRLQLHLARLRLARRLTFVYPLTGYDGREWWYLLERGQVLAAIPANGDEGVTRNLLEQVYARKLGAVDRVESMLLSAMWFRKRPAEKERGLVVEEAMKRAACGSAGGCKAASGEG